MCGIAGVVSINKVQEDIVERMAKSMKHRGPDSSGISHSSADGLQFVLAHTRLAILDLSPTGNQPMQDPSTGNIIVFNGEIYNFRDLRADLGGQWSSNSDTEAILRGYEKWGTSVFARLRGMFALALYDAQNRRLILARDPFGIKPLYYNRSNTVLAFASEVRTLLEAQIAPRKLSRSGLESYLRFGSVQEPYSMVEGVLSLKPGHILSVSETSRELRMNDQCYTEVRTDLPKFSRREEAVHALRTILEDSISAHLVSDVPVAAFLSGGIDSSGVVALMNRVSGQAPRTFTVTFEEQAFSEGKYANRIARDFQTVHTEVPLSETDLLTLLPEGLSGMDQPTMDGINSYIVARAVSRAGIKVALSGLGGDELFAGYPSFRRAIHTARLARVPGSFRRAGAAVIHSRLNQSVSGRKASRFLFEAMNVQDAYNITREVFAANEVEALTGLPAVLIEVRLPENGDAINEMSRYEIEGYMTSTLLRDTDQMSMAHSLEVRVPFIDLRVVSFVLSIPGAWKMNGSRPKPLLLDALGDLLPHEITNRKKMGFTLPFERWMKSRLRPEVQDVLSSKDALARAGLGEAASSVWREFCEKTGREKWSRSWALYVLARWCEINGVSA